MEYSDDDLIGLVKTSRKVEFFYKSGDVECFKQHFNGPKSEEELRKLFSEIRKNKMFGKMELELVGDYIIVRWERSVR